MTGGPRGVEVRPARRQAEWEDAAQLLFAYHRETAVEVGSDPPGSPQEVWRPVRHEVLAPAEAFGTYLIAYEGHDALGGVALVAHDALAVMLKRCYVHRDRRRQGVARELVAAADHEAGQRGAARLVLDILPCREGGITAWQRIGFRGCEPWGAASMRYFERPVPPTGPDGWLGLQRGVVTLHDPDPRWGTVFHHHREVVHLALADRVADVEHVGSTAVTGLIAKPIVDVAVRLTPSADEASVIASLQRRGYEFRGDTKDSGGLLFVAADQRRGRIAHLHVLHDGDHQWERYLLARDTLRADDRTRAAYAALKRDLALRFPTDRAAYTDAKRSFFDVVLAAG